MDKDRLKSLCSKILSKKKITISHFECVNTFALSEEGKWVDDSHTVFLSINDNNEQKYLLDQVSKEMESIFGIEFIVDR